MCTAHLRRDHLLRDHLLRNHLLRTIPELINAGLTFPKAEKCYGSAAWKGYSEEEESTWEPESNIIDKTLIGAFLKESEHPWTRIASVAALFLSLSEAVRHWQCPDAQPSSALKFCPLSSYPSGTHCMKHSTSTNFTPRSCAAVRSGIMVRDIVHELGREVDGLIF